MAACRRTVELFYDVISPYSWVAFEVLCRYRPRWNLDLKFRPFYLAGVMGATGNRPPGFVPNKAKYMGKDLIRVKEFYGIPLNQPADAAKVMFEKGSLSTMRLLTAVNRYHPDKVEQLSREFWLRIWSRDEDIVELTSIQQVCEKAGLKKEESEFLMSKIGCKEIKDMLKETTQKAVDLGAFGAPTIVAYVNNQPHLFFGSDRFLLLAHLLGVDWEGPLKMETPKL